MLPVQCDRCMSQTVFQSIEHKQAQALFSHNDCEVRLLVYGMVKTDAQ